jgi:hypothetical protein
MRGQQAIEEIVKRSAPATHPGQGAGGESPSQEEECGRMSGAMQFKATDPDQVMGKVASWAKRSSVRKLMNKSAKVISAVAPGRPYDQSRLRPRRVIRVFRPSTRFLRLA